MLIVRLPDHAAMQRRRINADPKAALAVYAELKAQDVFGFGVTREELSSELLRRALLTRRR